jgi:glyoxylase-like metal-dependent hydrolase (beta-lactamase superfamily II)
MAALPDFVQALGDGIHVVDTGFQRPRFDAAYLVVEDGRAAFVDTGTNHGVPRLLAALEALGLDRDAVDYVIPTHVHLDHAGGAGLLMQALPRARLVVHPRGAAHLTDPVRLTAGVRAIYGDEEFERSYGEIVPVPPARMLESADGWRLSLGGRPLEFLDTPGHARHHHCIWDAASRGFFTGDTFGIAYPELATAKGSWPVPAATPVQFDPEAMRRSIDRLLAYRPACVYVTHYGRVAPVEPFARGLLAELDRMVAFAQTVEPGPGRHERLKAGLEEIHAESLAAHGAILTRAALRDLLVLDLELNAQGLAIWLDRETARAPQH